MINLEIYVENECANCQPAFDIAEMVQEQVPEVNVSILDLSRSDVHRPEKVFAVPTYLINGETHSLGNPDGESLVAELKELVNQEQVSL
ncbi:MAG: thioredoxin family protein [Anaerolineales bacterium]